MRDVVVVSIPAIKRSMTELTMVALPTFPLKQDFGSEDFLCSAIIRSRKSLMFSVSRVLSCSSMYGVTMSKISSKVALANLKPENNLPKIYWKLLKHCQNTEVTELWFLFPTRGVAIAMC